MGKHAKIAARLAALETPAHRRWAPAYVEYFRLFNATEYYEAHDVLEHLWLETSGPMHTFYKALIQLAGGFVHLRLHHEQPHHRIHGRRLRPANRLLLRSAELLAGFPEHHEGVSVTNVRLLALTTASRLEENLFGENPWSPSRRPRLDLPA
jgi:predicted metal-dependent hydrolase